jgi:hypothetical protein
MDRLIEHENAALRMVAAAASSSFAATDTPAAPDFLSFDGVDAMLRDDGSWPWPEPGAAAVAEPPAAPSGFDAVLAAIAAGDGFLEALLADC